MTPHRPSERSSLSHVLRPVATSLVGLALCVWLPACSHGSANLAGHWRGLRAEGVRADVADSANAYAAHLQMDVKGDVITLLTAKDSRADHYTVVQEDKARTVIVTDLDGEADPQTFTFTDAKTMKWAVASGSVIVFVKE